METSPGLFLAAPQTVLTAIWAVGVWQWMGLNDPTNALPGE